jgi:hypothetical protein
LAETLIYIGTEESAMVTGTTGRRGLDRTQAVEKGVGVQDKHTRRPQGHTEELDSLPVS